MAKIGDIDLGDFPILLAPMEDVSDPPFRTLCKKHGADVMYTEFISVEGLIRQAGKSVAKLDFSPEERPLGIQIFGSDIESMVRAAEIAEEAKPDFLDLNFGCPVSKVAGKGGGAGLLRDIDKMVEMSRRIVEAVKIPVTAKTRLGWDEHSIRVMEIAERLQDVGICALTIHGRTRCQMYKGQADWEEIARVKNNPRIRIPIFGNGDVDSPEKALSMRDRYGLDGAMIGRAAIGNPWIFSQVKHFLKTGEKLPLPSLRERAEAAKELLTRAIEWKGERIGLFETRKHYTNFFKGIENFKDTRLKLCTSASKEEVFDILESLSH